MKKVLRWYDFINVNIYWLGLNVASGTITPVLLPYLVALFVPEEEKNTYLAMVRVIGLAVAMLIQPMAGMLSDRSTSRFGRRRPYIFTGTMFDLLFLVVVGAAPLFVGSALDGTIQPLFGVSTAYVVLLVGIVLLQVSSNVAHGALQGLIPDLVPEQQRGRASGVKSVMELLPVFLVIFIGPLVDRGLTWATVGIIGGSLLLTMLLTIVFVREEPLKVKPTSPVGEPLLRLVALTAIFLAVTQGAVWLVRSGGELLAARGAAIAVQVTVVGLAGLVGMAGSIFVGVYFGAQVGIGREARQQKPFIWWVINRLLFLAAIGSIQGFAQYYLRDVLHIPNAATMTTVLLAVVAVFLLPSALIGGHVADGRIPAPPKRPGRLWLFIVEFPVWIVLCIILAVIGWVVRTLRLHTLGHKRLVGLAGLIAAGGTLLLLFAGNIPLVLVSGCIIGVGTGTFMATNWALGTNLVPPKEAGRYLGISNLAGAGAGIVGAGIGGPMADFFNGLQPGLGYLVIFAIYGALFLLSVAALAGVRLTGSPADGRGWLDEEDGYPG